MNSRLDFIPTFSLDSVYPVIDTELKIISPDSASMPPVKPPSVDIPNTPLKSSKGATSSLTLTSSMTGTLSILFCNSSLTFQTILGLAATPWCMLGDEGSILSLEGGGGVFKVSCTLT